MGRQTECCKVIISLSPITLREHDIALLNFLTLGPRHVSMHLRFDVPATRTPYTSLA